MIEKQGDIIDINEVLTKIDQEIASKPASELLDERAFELLNLPSVQFKHGKLIFYPKNDINLLQFGYRNDPDTGNIYDDWFGTEYVVVGLDSETGQVDANQFIINAFDYMLPVYWLMTDGGDWKNPELICDSLEKFNAVIKMLKSNEAFLTKDMDSSTKDQIYNNICSIIGTKEISDYWMKLLNNQLEIDENNDIDEIENKSDISYNYANNDDNDDKIKTSVQFQLSNCVLYDYVFHKWDVFSGLLSNGTDFMKKMLFGEWNRIKAALLNKGNYYLNDANKNITIDDFNITINISDMGTKIYFVSFPDYDYTDSASKYVAFGVISGKIFYYTLEYSFDFLAKKPCWIIGRFYDEDGRKAHSNMGVVDNMLLLTFTKRVLEMINNIEQENINK